MRWILILILIGTISFMYTPILLGDGGSGEGGSGNGNNNGGSGEGGSDNGNNNGNGLILHAGINGPTNGGGENGTGKPS